ncbi:MAG TPA: EH signature domain-containing protein [Desulfomonilia bacterium]|nr:EH signature domain-containing protein [Desulfomonilia bacterium]
MNALELLRLKLHQTFTGTIQDITWGRTDLMSTVLEEVCSVFDTSFDNTSRRSIGRSLVAFRASSKLPTFLDLKYVCFGISQKSGEDGWILLEDKGLFETLLREVDSQSKSPRRFRKCCQGLMAGYFNYGIFNNDIPEQGRNNWLSLRSFLHSNLPVVRHAVPQLNWVTVISEHMNLLEDDPCERYGASLAHGDYSELKSVFRGLSIPRNSWVWEMIVLARMKAMCRFDDNEFKKQLAYCLAMINGNSDILLSGILKRKCIAQILRRYAGCASHPENTALRDSAVTHLGNPWIDRAAWDAHVKDDEARTMVDLWLKRRLITDFFQVLAGDRSAHMVRLRYWLRFMPKIEDIWIALGPYALNHPGSVFREFRKTAKDRILALENAGIDNENALIIRIGDFVFVELASSEEACMVFKNNELPFDLDKKWIYIGSQSGSGLRVRHIAGKSPCEQTPIPKDSPSDHTFQRRTGPRG